MSIDELADNLPFGDLTTPEAGFDIAMNAVVNAGVGKKDKLKNKDQFNSIVLMQVTPKSANGFTARQISAMFGTNVTVNDGIRYVGYRVRITDFDNPHAFYPVPCNLQGDPTPVDKVIAGMHTLILVPKDITLKPNDTCIIKLNKTGGKYELAYGFYISKTGTDENFRKRIQKQSPYLKEACRAGTGALFTAKIGSVGAPNSSRFEPEGVVDSGTYKDFPIYPRGRTPISPFGLGFRNKVEDYSFITLHTTVAPSVSYGSPGAVLTDLGSEGASYHYIIEANGEILQVIDHKVATAFHGNTESDSRPNKFSIGISLSNVSTITAFAGKTYKTAEGKNFKVQELDKWLLPKNLKCPSCKPYPDPNTPHQPFPKKQVDALIKLMKDLKKAHPTIKHVVGHEDINPSGKSDPGPAFYEYWPRVYRETGLTQSPQYPPKGNFRPSSK